MYWFQMFHDSKKTYPQCHPEETHGYADADHEIGFALFEKFRVELEYFKQPFSMGKLGFRHENTKYFGVFALHMKALNLIYIEDDETHYDDQDNEIPDKDREFTVQLLGRLSLTIRLDAISTYIYHFPHKDERMTLIDRLNLIINPSHLEGYEEYYDDEGRLIKRKAWEL